MLSPLASLSPFGHPRFVAGGAFSPSDISGLKLWVKADSLSASDGGLISSWTDSSGQGNHATASGTARPTYKTGIINGLPVLRFNGTTNVMVSLCTPNSAHSLFFVAVQRSYPNSYNPEISYQTNATAGVGSDHGAPHYIKSDNTAAAYIPISNGGSPSFSSYDGVGSYAIGTAYIFALSFQTGSPAAFKNGTAEGTLSAGSYCTDIAATQLGGQVVSGLSRFSNVDLAEAIIYDSALNSTNRGSVQSYLSAKYGI